MCDTKDGGGQETIAEKLTEKKEKKSISNFDFFFSVKNKKKKRKHTKETLYCIIQGD